MEIEHRYAIFDFLAEQYTELGEEGFTAWLHNEEPTERDLFISLMQDPAYKLRPAQRMPLDRKWRIWLLKPGRGWGKGVAACMAVHMFARDWFPGGTGILVGSKHSDVRDVMIKGESGLIATAPPGFVPTFNVHSNTILWPNGSSAIVRTADSPEDIRGPSISWAWGDELVKWRDPITWDNLNRCVRSYNAEYGTRIILTTTPKASHRWLRELEDDPDTITTRGSALENDSLDESYLRNMRKDLTSARGREEVLGEDVEPETQLWTEAQINGWRDATKAVSSAFAQTMKFRVISVDPAGGKGRDDTGIMVQGIKPHPATKEPTVYQIADRTSSKTVNGYCDEIIELAGLYLQQGDRVLIEGTGIGQACISLLRHKAPHLRIVEITPSKSKWARAEEAFGHCMGGRVRFVGVQAELEDQLCNWQQDAKDSPDRGDAFTQGVKWLIENKGKVGMTIPMLQIRL